MGRRVLGLVPVLAGVVALGLGAGACGDATAPAPASPGAWMPAGRVVPGSDLTGAGAFLGPVRQVTVGDITMGYRHFGRGPQLVMVTGDTAPMSLWTPELLRNLARSFSVTIFDNRGVGYTSDDLSRPITVPAMADETAALITVLHLGRPILLGWSMGGEIGLTVAVRHPHVLSKLVTTGADFGGRQALQPPAAVAAELNDPSTTPDQLLSLIFPPSAHQAVAAFVHQYLSVPQEKVSARTLLRQGAAEEAWYRYEGTYDGLPRVSVPVLITNGAEDQVNPPGNALLIRRRIGHGTVALFPGAGHAMLFQDTATFVADVRRFADA